MRTTHHDVVGSELRWQLAYNIISTIESRTETMVMPGRFGWHCSTASN